MYLEGYMFAYYFLWFKTNLSCMKDLATIFAMLVGSYVGLRGLKAWKLQLKGNQDYKLAKSTMLNCYKYCRSLTYVKSPTIFDSEYPKLSESVLDYLSDSEINHIKLSHIYNNRLDRITQIKPAFDENILEGCAVWGSKFKKIMTKLAVLENELCCSTLDHIGSTKVKVPYEDSVANELRESADLFRTQLKGVVEELEKFLMPYLKLY
jgi:hypothetical protein